LLSLSPIANLSANEDGQQEFLTINGFYTLDLSYASSSVGVISNGNVIRLLDENEVTLKNSIVGLQLDLDLTPDLGIVFQASAFYDSENTLDESLDWAYLHYDPGNDYDIRLGRFLTPFMQGTELKSVGYSRLWVRPLVPGSGAGGFIENEGIELVKRIPLNDTFLSIQTILAEPEYREDTVNGNLLGLISIDYEWGSSWLRAAYAHVDYEVSASTGSQIDDSAAADMFSLETKLHLSKFVLNAGLSKSRADIISDESMVYLSVAYPIGSFTPYVLTTRIKQEFEANSTSASLGDGWSQAQLAGDNDLNSLGVGFRFDLDGSYAIKAQFERIAIDDDSNPMRSRKESDGNVLTLLLEGVF
jgi:hypothetical protein